jgi:hypothetical protein
VVVVFGIGDVEVEVGGTVVSCWDIGWWCWIWHWYVWLIPCVIGFSLIFDSNISLILDLVFPLESPMVSKSVEICRCLYLVELYCISVDCYIFPPVSTNFWLKELLFGFWWAE